MEYILARSDLTLKVHGLHFGQKPHSTPKVHGLHVFQEPDFTTKVHGVHMARNQI